MQETILQSVGHTPLVRLRRVTEGLKAAVYAKVESLNPGGSVKDRVAMSMVSGADRLAREVPGAWRPNQFANLSNPEVHFRTTGMEIWDQTEGRISAFIAGVGTGGSISGVARYLKEQNPDIRIIGADPEGSVLSGDAPHPWKVEGIGEDFVPKTLNSQMVDEWVRVSDAESFYTARALARREGLLVGGSSGTAVAAALRYARRVGTDRLVVALRADTGLNYLS